ncbi:MAG: DNA repair protein rad52 [Vezdaea acicularis]|nr:MAG: DNA repair protein rad52 [Vezdaea acicularis]
MPAQGDQHRETPSTVNPFVEGHRISAYTAQEIATLSSRLEKQLGPEYLSSRPGAAGQKVHYLSGDKSINLANEVFGFNGWSSAIQTIQVDFVDESPSSGKISLGLSVVMRVTLKDGTYHEDIGYGHIENAKGKAAAFEKAKKEGTTDALKRALRNFGNVLGNCIYDKEYVAKVTKVKTQPTKWDVEKLHRHQDYSPVKKAPDAMPPDKTNGFSHVPKEAEVEDEFGGDDFDEELDFNESTSTLVGNPDEVVLDEAPEIEQQLPAAPPRQVGTRSSIQPPAIMAQQQLEATAGQPQLAAALQNQLPLPQNKLTLPQQPKTPGPPNNRQQYAQSPRVIVQPRQTNANHIPQPQPPLQQNPHPAQPSRPARFSHPQSPAPQTSPRSRQSTTFSEGDAPPLPLDVPGFFPARAIINNEGNNAAPVPQAPSFNPHAESPSIRKTSGIDHSKSKPIPRQVTTGAIPQSAETAAVPARPNYVNPQLDSMRQIGRPASGPPRNAGQYRLPGPAANAGVAPAPDGPPLKRPNEGTAAGYEAQLGKRQVLNRDKL